MEILEKQISSTTYFTEIRTIPNNQNWNKALLFHHPFWRRLTYRSAKSPRFATRERLGAALGCIFTGVTVLEHRRTIYESIYETRPYLPPKSRVSEPIFGSQSRSDFARLWNKAVDQTFRPVLEALSSRGW